ncbi:hypothetical protein OPT61_g902 [Boeremia exigua]|uniref:Uncharacterized protein n=1 Tax=Boeremia exigua TaxID=749465 RepID=A0ACC2IS44_9PLEO|nr:hypothetical protein OPT61_g902 [Boeremia exigua]
MLLPSELRTLVFLAGWTAARVHADDTSVAQTYTNVPNTPTATLAATSAPLPSSLEESNNLAPPPSDSISETPQEPQPTDEIDVCLSGDPPDWCEPPSFWHPEVTATAWDDWSEWENDGIGGGGGQGFAPPSTAVLRPPEQTPVVITTRTPTIIEIRTSIDPSAPEAVVGGVATSSPEPEQANDGHTEKQSLPAQPTAEDKAPQNGGSGGGTISQGAPPSGVPGQPAPAQPTAWPKPSIASQHTMSLGNGLLDAIISQLGKAQPGAQPYPSSLPATKGSGETLNHEPQTASPTGTAKVELKNAAGPEIATSNLITPAGSDTASAHDSLAFGNTVTVGSATLTLTPGLSTIIGTGSDTTLVAIQTDSASQTVITISSSGTAITATITNAPAMVTLPRTGFEVSTTGDGSRDISSHSSSVTAVTTSRGAASDKRANSQGTNPAAINAGFGNLPAILLPCGLNTRESDDVEEGKVVLRAMGVADKMLSLLPALALAASVCASPLSSRDDRPKYIPGKYLVQLQTGADAASVATHHENARRLARRDESHEPIERIFKIGTLDAYLGDFDEQTAAEILKLDEVVSVVPDEYIYLERTDFPPVKRQGRDLATQSPSIWSLGDISHKEAGATEYVYDDSAGEGMTAYVFDTGIRLTHEEFEGRARFGYDGIRMSADPRGASNDTDGHGTHCAGTIAGKTYGVAKKAKVVDVKIFDGATGSTSWTLAGIEWALSDVVARGTQNTTVFSMSLGVVTTATLLDDAVRAVYNAGILSVAAAGNSNEPIGNNTPARVPQVLTVGMSNQIRGRVDLITDIYGSNFGPEMDVFAPGQEIVSASHLSNTGSAIKTGTSMATPLVAGLVCYLRALEGGLGSPDEARDRIVELSLKDVVGDPRGSPNRLVQNGVGA